MIKVTDNAKSKALQLMSEDGKNGYFIRVGVKGGGCSGLMYELDFDNKLNDSDKSFEDNGIKVVVDKKSFLYLIGTTLDFLQSALYILKHMRPIKLVFLTFYLLVI